jgi:hypothetical protein
MQQMINSQLHANYAQHQGLSPWQAACQAACQGMMSNLLLADAAVGHA